MQRWAIFRWNTERQSPALPQFSERKERFSTIWLLSWIDTVYRNCWRTLPKSISKISAAQAIINRRTKLPKIRFTEKISSRFDLQSAVQCYAHTMIELNHAYHHAFIREWLPGISGRLECSGRGKGSHSSRCWQFFYSRQRPLLAVTVGNLVGFFPLRRDSWDGYRSGKNKFDGTNSALQQVYGVLMGNRPFWIHNTNWVNGNNLVSFFDLAIPITESTRLINLKQPWPSCCFSRWRKTPQS